MDKLLLLALPLLLWACQGDETVSGYAGGAGPFRLVEMGGTPAEALVTLAFPEEGRIAGRTPCGPYSGRQSAPYPWFETEAMEMPVEDCADPAEQRRLRTTFAAMTLAEVQGDTLILSNGQGGEMVFRRQVGE